MKRNFINFCSNVRNASRARKLQVIVKSNNLIIKILKILYKEGFINGYSCINKYEIKIYLKYNMDKGLLDYLKIGYGKHYNLKKLWYLYNGTNKNDYYMLFSSSKGLYELNELLKLSIGGILLLIINIP